MTTRAWLTVEKGDTAGALRRFLAQLLESGTVEALLIPCRAGDSPAVVPTLVKSAAVLAKGEPLAPLMTHNSASLVSRLTVLDTGRRVGVLLRPCELRALIELTKLHQASLDHVLTIGIDCMGTFEGTDYLAMVEAGLDPASLWAGAPRGEPAVPAGFSLRTACGMCEYPAPAQADIRIGLIGVEPGRVLIESEAPLDFLEEAGEEVPAGRREAVDALRAARTARRDALLSAWRARTDSPAKLAAEFAACIRCHNCMVACPICYCKECIFRTPTFDHEPAQYFRWAERKGALRMPSDTLLFHITRLNHMATSCVGCGMCDSACPNDLPVATLFRAVAQEVQALFAYEAGRGLDEPPPVADFREDELQEMGR